MVWSARCGLLATTLFASWLQGAPVQLDQWTIEHFRRAREAQRENRLEAASDEYQLILTKNPKFAEAYLNLGIVYQLQNRYGEAIRTFETGLSLKPDMAGAQVLLGISYYMVQDFRSALTPLQQALKANPEERQAGIYLALALLGLDEPEKAAAQLRQTASYFPDDVEIFYHLGEVYNEGVRQSAQLLLKASRDTALYPWASGIAAERKQDTASAIEEYLRALERDPNIPQLYFRLAMLFQKVGMRELSEHAARRFALLNPGRAGELKALSQTSPRSDRAVVPDGERNFQRLWDKLGAVRFEPGQPSVGDTFLNKAVRQCLAADSTGEFKEAFAFFQQGSFQAAAQRFKAIVLRQPRDWVPAYLLARAYAAEGDYDAAEEVIERWLPLQFRLPPVALLKLEIQTELALRYYDLVLSKQPNSVRARMLRAKSFVAAMQPEKAIEEYRDLLRTQPDLPQLHLAIAQVYSDQLNWPAVIEELHKELELSQDNGAALALLGHAYAESNEPDRAIDVLTKVLGRYPRDASALADLGKAWTQKGETTKAIHILEQAMRYDESQYRLHYRLFQLYKSVGEQDLAQKHLGAFQASEAKRRKTNVIAGQ